MSIDTLAFNPTIQNNPLVGSPTLLAVQTKVVSQGSFNEYTDTYTFTGIKANKPLLVQVSFQVPDGVVASSPCLYNLYVNGVVVGSQQTLYTYSGRNLNVSFSTVLTPSTAVSQFQPRLLCNGSFFSTVSQTALTTISIFQ